jgi:hypothetical protein
MRNIGPAYGRRKTAVNDLPKPTDQMLVTETRPALTTKADHNGIRLGPIPADAPKAHPQVSDDARQPGRILQAGDHEWGWPDSIDRRTQLVAKTLEGVPGGF